MHYSEVYEQKPEREWNVHVGSDGQLLCGWLKVLAAFSFLSELIWYLNITFCPLCHLPVSSQQATETRFCFSISFG